jgi:hypothetical protein
MLRSRLYNTVECCCLLAFKPLALLMARSGLNTRHTRKIFTTPIAPALYVTAYVSRHPMKINVNIFAERAPQTINYPSANESRATPTTSISSRLKGLRQNEPLCNTIPYDTTLNPISTVKTAVKNASKYLRICIRPIVTRFTYTVTSQYSSYVSLYSLL